MGVGQEPAYRLTGSDAGDPDLPARPGRGEEIERPERRWTGRGHSEATRPETALVRVFGDPRSSGSVMPECADHIGPQPEAGIAWHSHRPAVLLVDDEAVIGQQRPPDAGEAGAERG